MKRIKTISFKNSPEGSPLRPAYDMSAKIAVRRIPYLWEAKGRQLSALADIYDKTIIGEQMKDPEATVRDHMNTFREHVYPRIRAVLPMEAYLDAFLREDKHVGANHLQGYASFKNILSTQDMLEKSTMITKDLIATCLLAANSADRAVWTLPQLVAVMYRETGAFLGSDGSIVFKQVSNLTDKSGTPHWAVQDGYTPSLGFFQMHAVTYQTLLMRVGVPDPKGLAQASFFAIPFLPFAVQYSLMILRNKYVSRTFLPASSVKGDAYSAPQSLNALPGAVMWAGYSNSFRQNTTLSTPIYGGRSKPIIPIERAIRTFALPMTAAQIVNGELPSNLINIDEFLASDLGVLDSSTKRDILADPQHLNTLKAIIRLLSSKTPMSKGTINAVAPSSIQIIF